MKTKHLLYDGEGAHEGLSVYIVRQRGGAVVEIIVYRPNLLRWSCFEGK